MVARSIEVNNGRFMHLNLLNKGLEVTTVDDKGHPEWSLCIDDDALVTLINLYDELRCSDEKSAYIIRDEAKKILQESYGSDFVDEYQIIQ